MRLFIGTSIFTGAIHLIENELEDLRTDMRFRFAPIKQWHVTALFIGERDETVVPSFNVMIEAITRSQVPIILNNGQICTMPEDLPRMLWVKFDPSEALTKLHHSLAEALDAKASAHLPYQPHITLARSKERTVPYAGPIVLEELTLDHISLFSTQRSPSGSIHHPMGTWMFNGKDPTDLEVVV